MNLELMTLDDFRDQIEGQIENSGPYSHNIVSVILGIVSRRFGLYTANSLVDEFQLDVAFGIYKVRHSSKQRGGARFRTGKEAI